MPFWCQLLFLPLWALVEANWTTSNGAVPTEDYLPGSMVQQDDEDFENEGSGYPYSPPVSTIVPVPVDSFGTTTILPPSTQFNGTLFQETSTIRPVIRPTAKSGDEQSLPRSTPAAAPSESDGPPGNEEKSEELSTALIVGITVSCIVVSGLCVAMIVYTVLRTRRRRRAG
ncbi:Putative nuclear hormone receptor HR38 [Trichuris trichiura]|uniref:Putative nuclear hormone receptor HR38 n=1 Tax=Trichuris trichiura TaxID=36087 RepID=A0A077Z3H5_TRITR|nr:Putative nuclear hormone receptor HR38 [Trichuris trichiura]